MLMGTEITRRSKLAPRVPFCVSCVCPRGRWYQPQGRLHQNAAGSGSPSRQEGHRGASRQVKDTGLSLLITRACCARSKMVQTCNVRHFFVCFKLEEPGPALRRTTGRSQQCSSSPLHAPKQTALPFLIKTDFTMG